MCAWCFYCLSGSLGPRGRARRPQHRLGLCTNLYLIVVRLRHRCVHWVSHVTCLRVLHWVVFALADLDSSHLDDSTNAPGHAKLSMKIYSSDVGRVIGMLIIMLCMYVCTRGKFWWFSTYCFKQLYNQDGKAQLARTLMLNHRSCVSEHINLYMTNR